MPWRQLAYADSVAVLTNTAPADVDGSAAAVGASGEAARSDHVHAFTVDVAELSDVAPDGVDGSAAAAGVGTAASRDDHIHALGPLVADLDFNQNRAVGMVLETVATAPDSGAEVEGQLYYDTADDNVYVWNGA